MTSRRAPLSASRVVSLTPFTNYPPLVLLHDSARLSHRLGTTKLKETRESIKRDGKSTTTTTCLLGSRKLKHSARASRLLSSSSNLFHSVTCDKTTEERPISRSNCSKRRKLLTLWDPVQPPREFTKRHKHTLSFYFLAAIKATLVGFAKNSPGWTIRH